MKDLGTKLHARSQSELGRGRIYIDLDDVLCRTIGSFVDLVRREFGTSVDLEAVASFDLQKSFGLAAAEYKRFWDLAHERESLLAIPPLAGALDNVAHWFKLGYRISIVTGRPPATRPVSEEWLQNNCFPYDDLTYVDKYNRWGHRSVVDSDFVMLGQLTDTPFRLVIEDEPSIAKFLAQQGSVRSVVVLDWPWNRMLANEHGSWLRKLTRCRDWAEVRQTFPRP